MKRLLPAIAGFLVCCLAACGGGGGGGGGSDTATNPSQNTDIGLSIDRQAPIVLVQELGQPGPPPVHVHMSYTLGHHAVGFTDAPGTNSPWALASYPEGDTSSPLDVTFSVNEPFLQLMKQGHYQTTIDFQQWSDTQFGQGLITLPLTLVIAHSFGLGHSDLSISQGETGPQAAVHVALQADTVRWSAKTSVPWLTVDQASGTGSGTLGLSVTDSSLAPGTHDATVTVTDLDYNVPETMTVTVHVQPRTLVARTRGVGMTSAPGWSALSASIPVTDSAGLPSTWSASSDQSWLILDTPTGSSGGALSVHADPTGLTEGMHYAEVTLNPTTQGVTGTPSVRVGLYVSASPASPTDITRTPGFNQAATACDSTRPYCYAVASDVVTVFNVFSGKSETTIPTGGFTGAISSDSKTLYVVNDQTGTIVPIDLDSMTAQPALPLAFVPPRPVNMPSSYSLVAGDIGGRPVLVTSELHILDATTGQTLEDFSALLPAPLLGMPTIGLSHDGRLLVVRSNDDSLLYRMEVDSDGNFGVGISETYREVRQTYARDIQFASNDSSFLCSSDQVRQYPSGNVTIPSTVRATYTTSYVQSRDDDSFFLYVPRTALLDGTVVAPAAIEHRAADNHLLQSFPLGLDYADLDNPTLIITADQRRLALYSIPSAYVDLP